LKEFHARLKSKDIIFENIQDKVKVLMFHRKWLNAFVGAANTDYFLGAQFLWDIFCTGQIDFFEKQKATDLFQAINKTECFVFTQNDNILYYLKNIRQLSADDIIGLQDVYVTDRWLRWTYVVTHEICEGPYFCEQRLHNGAQQTTDLLTLYTQDDRA
jgi:hypothetical protein